MISRRKALRAGAGLAAIGALGAPAIAHAETKTLKITTWGGKWGDIMKATVLPAFEKEFKCTVSADQAFPYVPKMQASSRNDPLYDVLHTNSNEQWDAFTEGLVMGKITAKEVPNVADVYPYAVSDKIVGVSTSKSGVYNRNGIDVDALFRYHQDRQTLAGFPSADEISSEELLVAECDILIPGAIENQITSRNADRVKAKILCEGANGPTTAEADDILTDKRVFVIPDILANSGGVTVSYFEWVQDRQGYFWKEAVVNEQLESILAESFGDVVRYAEAHAVNNRIAAYMLAIDRVAFTIKQRGIYA